jgi:hypothetical protein
MLYFTIRDVLWLTVVVALAVSLGVGWATERFETTRHASPLVSGNA